MMEIRLAGPEDLGAIKTLLAICLLPTQELRSGSLRFFVAESERGIIGVAGVDDCGNGIAFLRSVAVMPGYRKQQIGRRLVSRVIVDAEELGIGELYLLTESAADYFQGFGFSGVSRDSAPPELRNAPLYGRLCTGSARLLLRQAQVAQTAGTTHVFSEVARAAQAHFDAGYLCAESVLLAVAESAGIRSPLLPAIATGFCQGAARTFGTCGALSGAVMAVNLVYGRQSAAEPVAENHAAVRALVDEFAKTCGSTNCSELLALDLDTKDGQRLYEQDRLRDNCRQYIGAAARLAANLVHQRVDMTLAAAHSSVA